MTKSSAIIPPGPRPTHDYIAKKKCGCVIAICYDLGDKDTARDVANWIKNGLTVDRVPMSEAVDLLKAGFECKHPAEGQLTLEL